MIQETLLFISQELNQWLKKKTSSTEDFVVMNNLFNNDGTTPANMNNKVVLSFIHFRMDTATRSSINSMSILITPVFSESNYQESLKFLDLVIFFFQEHASIKQTDFVHIPQPIHQIEIQLQQDVNEIRAVWASLGTGYKPSAIYELRLT